MTLFKPWVGKVISGQTRSGFSVITPFFFFISLLVKKKMLTLHVFSCVFFFFVMLIYLSYLFIEFCII